MAETAIAPEVKTPPPHTLTMKANSVKVDETAAPAIAQPAAQQPAADANANPANANPNPAQAQAQPANPAEQTAAPATPAKKFNIDEIDEDELDEETLKKMAKILAKKNPTPAAPTKEEIEAEEAKTKKEAHAWAIENEVVKKDKYDAAIVDKSKTEREIALKVFAAEAREDNPKLTDEEVEEMYKDHAREELADDDPKRKLALRAQKKVAVEYLAQYKDVDGIVDNYKAWKSEGEKYKSFTKQVSETVKALPKEIEVSVPYMAIGATVETPVAYKVPVDEAIYNQVKNEFANQQMFYGLKANEKELKPEVLHEKIMYHVKAMMFDKAIAAASKLHAEKEVGDTLLNLKNARNPQQAMGTPSASTSTTKTPPPHTLTLAANKAK